MNEFMARRILEQALTENRCADLLNCLLDGGSVTVDGATGLLVLASRDMLRQMISLGEMMEVSEGDG